jgi:predicted nucleotidyltransferase
MGLRDSVAYHDSLSPVAWDDDRLKPEVRRHLLMAAKNFVEAINIKHFDLIDIRLTGSMANYNYTKYSDFDLHLITDYSKLGDVDIAQELYDAKKRVWNSEHDVKIKNHEVEVYVEDASEAPVSQGVYSILNNRWLSHPEFDRPSFPYADIKHRATHYQDLIMRALRSHDEQELNTIIARVKSWRRQGLAQGGEFSIENMAYKVLRNAGLLDKLYKAKAQAQDREMSLSERR